MVNYYDYGSTRYGNSIVHKGDTYLAAGNVTQPTYPLRTHGTLLIDCNLETLAKNLVEDWQAESPASWVLTLSMDPVDPNVLTTFQQALPMLAQITIGNSGANHTIICDVSRGATIPLHGNTIRCVVGWDDTWPGSIPPPYPYTLPDMKVRGVIQRTWAIPDATRTFIMPTSDLEVTQHIPKFARAVRIITSTPSGTGPYDPGSWLRFFSGFTYGSWPAQEYSGADLETAMKAGTWLPIEGDLQFWQLSQASGSGVLFQAVSFRLFQ